jgi:hypothetical protein
MPRGAVIVSVLPGLIAMYLPFCATEIRPIVHPSPGVHATLWEAPVDLGERDLLYGPWGREYAPNPEGRYALVALKHTGTNPGMTVRDELGREWSVKQAPVEGWDAEGPIEVVLSRVLSAIGYHQPPVYYLRDFTLIDDWGQRRAGGGRFRLKLAKFTEIDNWSWQQNPFVDTVAYRGLLVTLLMFNSSDLKNSNNSLYELREGKRRQHQYLVRDLGAALGSTGRFAPRKSDPTAFARHGFIKGVADGFVEFEYRGWHQELVRRRITPADVRWASHWLAQLSERQWHDAFAAGGYAPETAALFIDTLQKKITEGQRLIAN